MENIEIFGEKYSQTLKTFDATIILMTNASEKFTAYVNCICRFVNLKSLRLYISDINSLDPIDQSLSLIGQNCNKLVELYLTVTEDVPISGRFFNVFTHFRAIKKLKFKLLNRRKVLSGSVECFKHCKQIKNLDINYHNLTEEFFTNFQLFIPKLQFLNITTEKQFSESFINSFLPMKSIQRVVLLLKDANYKTIDEQVWEFGKCLSQVMSTSMGSDVKRMTHNWSRVLWLQESHE